jgi:hypothetical protein
MSETRSELLIFARRVYLIAAVYGLVVLLPQYAMERKHGLDDPPAITHPEYYYGFAGVALAWQFAFLLISRDPVRYRPLMLVGILEKAGFGLAAIALHLLGRLHVQMLAAGLVDLVLGVLFIVAYRKTPKMASPVSRHVA